MEHPSKKPYIVILAGGGGTRLWPKSTKSTPKQFLSLFSRRTLLQETFARVSTITDTDRIYVVAGRVYQDEIVRQLPELRKENLLIEPMAKNTAAAMGFAAAVVSQRDPEGVMTILASDHYISEIDLFQRVLLTASIVAETHDNVVLWGIVPTRPAAEYGYIQSGDEAMEVNGMPIFKVRGFKEKPNVATAQAYIATGKYFWNHSAFTQKARVLMEAFSKTMPDFYTGLVKIAESIGTDAYDQTLHTVFDEVTNIAFDVAVVEKIDNILMIPAPYSWSDVGSWDALYDILHNNDGTNSVVPGEEFHIGYDTHGCLVSADGKMVATIGLKDLIIVDTPHALMICPKDRAQDVKKLLEQLKERGRTDLL